MAKAKKGAALDAEETVVSTGNHYEEWRCEIKLDEKNQRTVEKIKRLRAVVKISDEEADTLNHGAKDSPRTDYVIMYFKPE